MKNKLLSVILCLCLSLTSCTGAQNATDSAGAGANGQSTDDTNSGVQSSDNTGKAQERTADVNEEDAKKDGMTDKSAPADTKGSKTDSAGSILTGHDSSSRSLLSGPEEIFYDVNLTPSIEPYHVEPDFSNVVYDDEFSYLFDENYEYSDIGKKLRRALIKDLFAVDYTNYDEFFEIYEGNRYVMFPSFITVDSLMHTYHLYFSYLMRRTEKEYLTEAMKDLSLALLEESTAQYKELSGTPWESAAFRNLCFLYTGVLLFDDSAAPPIDDKKLTQTAREEADRIHSAAGIEDSELTGLKEDYTQYKPRGYYAGDEELETYFRVMMWYGRTSFDLRNEDMIRSALLLTMAIDNAGYDTWKAVYDTTSFFAGSSDDPGYYELSDVIKETYGQMPDLKTLSGDDDSISKITKALGSLTPPAINSIPVNEGEDPVIPCFRFMGQRFTIDAAIMQKLIFSAVGENPSGEKRMLPDTLDTAAALGSKEAEKLLKDQGAYEYEGFEQNMEKVKEHFDNDDPELWNASLYSAWLNTLRPLFEEKKDGYPSYMHSDKWMRKCLETYAGSYAELKHDTILYEKQNMSEMGGGDMEILDDRGYVDPQPKIYSRFISLAKKTREGLDNYGLLTQKSQKDLLLLEEIAKKLLSISEKELTGQELTEDEFEFIRAYGGDLEHFWSEANSDKPDGTVISSIEAPCPIIADIATDPNGTILEIGTGSAETMYVVFPLDGELHIGRGSVYSFYQFTRPISERLTDDEWRHIISSGWLDDDFNWITNEDQPDRTEWTMDYRYVE